MAKLDHPAWIVFYLEKDAYCAEVDTVTDKIETKKLGHGPQGKEIVIIVPIQ